ncbi:hypothetical protein M408DRAFT_25176 [Serendipita vermifera MAFF 305830]|uniref:NACHT domain-containing protein n=1 Tax=Serendipita vermifera MAFF 305830 TaxID=933852 RepID=A0A0C3B3E2_SERVB|nr:hypothetical protein M408DRAFT_25176 [Serendipita vermifera MAFF 305830]
MKGFIRRLGKSKADGDKPPLPPKNDPLPRTEPTIPNRQSETVTVSENTPHIDTGSSIAFLEGTNVESVTNLEAISRKQKYLAWGETIFTGLKSISEASAVLAPLKAVCGIMKTVLHTIQELEKNKRDWVDILQTLQSHHDTFLAQLERITLENVADEENSPFFGPIRSYCGQLGQLLADLMIENGITSSTTPNNYQNMKSYLQNYGTTTIEASRIKEYSERLDTAIQEFKVSMLVYTAFELHAATQKLRQIDAKLTAASEGSLIPSYGSISPHGAQHTTCLEGTRTGIPDEIDQWSKDDSLPRIFILSDEAGTGKSTIAKQVAGQMATQNRLAAHFFFASAHKGTSMASDLCLFIPNDAAFMHSDLQTLVEDILDDQDAITRKPIVEQWNRLVCRPLALLSGGPFILVIDALDECTDDTRCALLSCIIDTFSTGSTALPNIKVLITMRPQSELIEIISKAGPAASKIAHLSTTPEEKNSSRRDVGVYVRGSFDPSLSVGLGEEDYEALVDKSEGLFVFAVMACTLLKRTYAPRELLAKILSTNQTTSLASLCEEVS